MAKTKGLKVGSKIAHKGSDCETFNKIYVVKIIDFEGLAIHVQADNGAKYFINTWDLCEMPKLTNSIAE